MTSSVREYAVLYLGRGGSSGGATLGGGNAILSSGQHDLEGPEHTGALDLDDLSDVDVATTPPTDGQTLVFNVASGLWIAGDAALPAIPTGVGDHEHMVDQFTGDGATTAFEITDEPIDPEAVAAFVAGVETAVTMSGPMNTTATFGAAPGVGARVIVEYPATAP